MGHEQTPTVKALLALRGKASQPEGWQARDATQVCVKCVTAASAQETSVVVSV